MVQTDPVTFNPLDPDFPKDPYSVYARLRVEAPVLESPFGAIVFSRYADIVEILKDPRSSSDGRNSNEFKEAIEQGLITKRRPSLRNRPSSSAIHRTILDFEVSSTRRSRPASSNGSGLEFKCSLMN